SRQRLTTLEKQHSRAPLPRDFVDSPSRKRNASTASSARLAGAPVASLAASDTRSRSELNVSSKPHQQLNVSFHWGERPVRSWAAGFPGILDRTAPGGHLTGKKPMARHL